MPPTASIRLRRAVCVGLMLSLPAALCSQPANAADLNPELSLGFTGLIAFGDLATVAPNGYGGDATFQMVRDGGGLGVRAAAGLELLQGHRVPTGETNFSPYGSGEGTFEANQQFWWFTIGPEWTRPAKSGRMDFYFMAGKAKVNASSSGGWISTVGIDPGLSSVWVGVLGAAWSPGNRKYELGAELLAGGSAVFWADPPAIEDSAGNHILQSKSAPLTAVVFRFGRRFGSMSGTH